MNASRSADKVSSCRYRPIADYALIGDCEGAALVSREGSIDWLCLPHFDSPAWLLKILDAEKGGYCSARPAAPFASTRRYLAETNILQTVFTAEGGRLELLDFMPPTAADHRDTPSAARHSRHSVVRRLECTDGSVRVRIELKLTPGYAAERAEPVHCSSRCIVVRGASEQLQVQASFDLRADTAGVITADLVLQCGETAYLALTAPPGGAALSIAQVEAMRTSTHDYWVTWMRTFRYQGPYRDWVVRSALTLKLLTFTHTGAVIAAPTTSLPEEIGGERNWDYRFSWLRDSSFTLMALLELGFEEEAQAYLQYLARVSSNDRERLRILYSIRGERAGAEVLLEHLAGYRGSRPVRIGNGAADQRQLDVYGEVIHAIYLYARARGADGTRELAQTLWPTVRRIGDYVAAHWREPDSGIWEVRSAERQFVHSKGMCYAALACALMLAKDWRISSDLSHWERERQAVRDYVWQQGFNSRVGAFTQTVGSDVLDAAVLRFPLLGIIDAHDPRMRATVQAIERALLRNGLVYRYLTADDGVRGGEATFAICTFWLVSNYVMQGRLAEAEALFEHVLSFANDVGLYAEEIDPVSRAQLGNFPQGFTHIGLIGAAARIAAARRGARPFSHHMLEPSLGQ